MINETLKEKDEACSLAYDAAAALVRKEVERALSASPPVIRSYTGHLALSWGKFIRARVLLACAEDRNGLISPDAVHLAAAVELLHLATLVHDDVIDNADTRRGIATLQKKFGKHAAVICGDYLFCASLQLAASISNKQDYLEIRMPNYMGRICLGELMQDVNHRNFHLSVRSYLKIIAGKTASLFEASCFGGAVLCGDAKEERNRYSRFGHYLGLIFQLTDDCIDFEASPQLAKKPVQSDYEQGVITLPLIYAFREEKRIQEKAETAGLSREEVNRAVLKTGGLKYTRILARRYYNKAFGVIQKLGASGEKKERLASLLQRAYFGLKQQGGGTNG